MHRSSGFYMLLCSSTGFFMGRSPFLSPEPSKMPLMHMPLLVLMWMLKVLQRKQPDTAAIVIALGKQHRSSNAWVLLPCIKKAQEAHYVNPLWPAYVCMTPLLTVKWTWDSLEGRGCHASLGLQPVSPLFTLFCLPKDNSMRALYTWISLPSFILLVRN